MCSIQGWTVLTRLIKGVSGVARSYIWKVHCMQVRMAANGWTKRFRFPGYDGALPKALRSIRGRGKYQHKVKRPPSDWGLFELLVTVAGQILQENNLNEDKSKRQAAFTNKKENAIENEEISQAALGFVQHPQSGFVGRPTDNNYKSKDVQHIDITPTAFERTVNNITKEGFGGVESVDKTLNCSANVPCADSNQYSNIVDSSDKGTNIIDGIVKSRVIDSKYTVWKGTNRDSSERGHHDMQVHSEGHGQSDRLGSEEESCVTLQHSIFLSCGSIEEDLTSVHMKPCEVLSNIASEKKLDTRQKLVCITAKDDDDNLSVSISPKTTSPQNFSQKLMAKESRQEELHHRMENSTIESKRKFFQTSAKDDDDNFSVSIFPKATSPQNSSQKLLAKELRQEEAHLGSVRMETSTIGSKRKFFQTPAEDASIGSSPHSSRKAAWREGKSSKRDSQGSSAVKVNITSFTVPELCIDLPKTATVANLKRAVMDAAINVLGGGLHVRVLHRGKKISDESTTLVQMGISSHERLDSLAFMLEPDRIADTTMRVQEPVFGFSNASNESTAWYPVFSFSEDMAENKGNPLNGEPCECVAMDVPHNLAPQEDSNVAIERGRVVEPRQYIASEAPLVLCGPLILHPGLKDTKVMNIVTAQQSFECTNSGKRRVRRPFTVIEVAALVQAVELLGTGRWREVKQQAFDNARHRTYVDLKDKWKTLVHTANIAPHQRRGEPVPQELLDRVLKAHIYWAAQQAKQRGTPGM